MHVRKPFSPVPCLFQIVAAVINAVGRVIFDIKILQIAVDLTRNAVGWRLKLFQRQL